GSATALLGIGWLACYFIEQPITFIGTLVIGWLALSTWGIYNHVVPFHVWFQRFSRRVGTQKVPAVKDLLHKGTSYFTTLGALAGVSIWSSGLALQSEALSFAGSGTLFLSCATSLFQIRHMQRDAVPDAVKPS